MPLGGCIYAAKAPVPSRLVVRGAYVTASCVFHFFGNGLELRPQIQHVHARQARLPVRCVLGMCGLLSYVPPWTKVA
mgnify:CR=1 FL=1